MAGGNTGVRHRGGGGAGGTSVAAAAPAAAKKPPVDWSQRRRSIQVRYVAATCRRDAWRKPC